MQLAATSIDTPLGRYALVATEAGLVSAKPADSAPAARAPAHMRSAAERILDQARAAFASYFAGSAAALDALPLDPHGSEFQRQVWRALREIPLGATASYGEIARRIGRPGAARAVGDANRRNPIAIAIPCHRVIGGDGQLVGYAGGLARKRWLSAHEAECARQLSRAASADSVGLLAHAASSKSNGPEMARLETAPARSRASATASI
jgi:methylated-DNA-[protein]-cysteine S-methyltransferase